MPRTNLESGSSPRNHKDTDESSASKTTVVSSLPDRSPDPFSSLALSPERNHAVVAGKDTLQLIQIDAKGLRSIRSIKIAHHFNVVDPSSASITKPGSATRRYVDVRDAFQLGTSSSAPRGTSMAHELGNISITKVAWSNAMDFSTNMTTIPGTSATRGENRDSSTPHHQQEHNWNQQSEGRDSFVAVAASNGVVVIWNANQLLFSEPSKATSGIRVGQGRTGNAFSKSQFHHQPEGVISQHVRAAVNSLSWHPKRAGLLLTASQDASVKLWERRLVGLREPDGSKQPRRPWYAVGGGKGGDKRGGRVEENDKAEIRTYSWKFKAGFEPKAEAIRDIQWSPYLDEIFGLVTANGSLILYSMHVSVRAMVKIAAHTGDATSLDWHPTRSFVIATGGSGDRTVKVWNLKSALDSNAKDGQDHSFMSANSNTWKSEVSTNSQSSSETDKSMYVSVFSKCSRSDLQL
jgi:WD repeat-containing protein 24